MTTTKRITGLAIIITILMNMFVFTSVGSFSASAKSKAKKAKYSIVKIDKTKKFDSGVTAKVYYNKVQLKGKSKAIKKINKAIEKDYKSFASYIPTVYYHAKNPITDVKETHFWISESKVTYNKKNILSIKITTKLYATGIRYTVNHYGLTFNTKTGKKLGIKSLCKYSTKELRTTVQKKLKKKYGKNLYKEYKEYTNNINEYKFYLKPGKKCVICFGAGAICYGESNSSVTIKSKYK